MVAGNILPSISEETDENKQLAGFRLAAVSKNSSHYLSAPARQIIRQRNKKEGFTETFKYFKKWS
jgi:hypothetical protein